MSDEGQQDRPELAVSMSNRDLLSVMLMGAAIGLIAWLIGSFLNRYVFDAFLCRDVAGRQCGFADDYAAVVAIVLGGIAALVGLIRLRVYRPLLIVLATAFSVWGVLQISWGMAWYGGLLLAVLFFALAYGLYAWTARIRVFWIAIVSTAVLIIGVRLALMQ